MTSDDFRSAPFRSVAVVIEAELRKLGQDALSAAEEAAHLHPFRVGSRVAYQRVLEILAEVEKHYTGEKE